MIHEIQRDLLGVKNQFTSKAYFINNAGIISPAAKEALSWIIGVSVVHEESESHQQRIADASGYHKRRYQMARDAAFEYPVLETLAFYEDAHRGLESFDPSSIKRRAWLDIRGHRIPLPFQRLR